MKIGIDMSPLQGPHRMRGIGYVTRNFIENIPDEYLSNQFVFYVNQNAEISPTAMIESLKVSTKLNYELRNTKNSSPEPNSRSKLSKAKRAYKNTRSFKKGASNFGDVNDLDVFIQFDQSKPFPKLRKKSKKVLIAYDLIPYILENEYLWNYRTSRIKGQSRKSSIKNHLRRELYRKNIKNNSETADIILAISEVTKKDFTKYLGIDSTKIKVITLGSTKHKENKFSEKETITIDKYRKTSFGHYPKPYTIRKDDKFIMFVGGADARRKLEDLVAAFNQLRSRGVDLKLFLAGDTMKGVDTIPTPGAYLALKNSAYIDDIIFAGFIDDNTRDWLYKNTNALVFPSIYEGFGLPVVEALRYGTNVISYDNQATLEIAGDIPLYAYNVPTLMQAISRCLKNKVSYTKDIKTVSWEETSANIMKAIA